MKENLVCRIVAHSREYVKVHRSVHTAHIDTPGQSRVSLDECFRLYTQEEKVKKKNHSLWEISSCNMYISDFGQVKLFLAMHAKL